MVKTNPAANFISCDWGTSHFRLRLIGQDQISVLARHSSAHGIQLIAKTYPAIEERQCAMAKVLIEGIATMGVADQKQIPVVISGMASSTLGWQSLPYSPLPAPIDGSTLHHLDFEIENRQVRLISGLKSSNDVMRGEETEMIGLFARIDPDESGTDCVVILPGTHSKHVRIQNGLIVDFTTYLTGELYHLLCESSTLCSTCESHFHQKVFIDGVQASQHRGMSAALFQTRARTLLGKLPPEHSHAFLSGVLIGAEIHSLAKEPPPRIILATSAQLTNQYSQAVASLLPHAVVTIVGSDDLAAAAILGHAKILSHL